MTLYTYVLYIHTVSLLIIKYHPLNTYERVVGVFSLLEMLIDLSTARPKWRLDGLALSGHLLYSLVNHAYSIRYHYYLVR